MNVKLYLGIVSLVPAVVAYYFYFRGIVRGTTKPHAFSWAIWGSLAGIGFVTQVSAHAGVGAWVTGLTSLASLTIFCFALRVGTVRSSPFDWSLLCLAALSLVLLLVVKDEVAALGLTLIALISGFVMNARKAYKKPQEENATAFGLNTLKFVPAIFALTHITFLTAAYPMVAAMGNAAITIIVWTRGGWATSRNADIHL